MVISSEKGFNDGKRRFFSAAKVFMTERDGKKERGLTGRDGIACWYQQDRRRGLFDLWADGDRKAVVRGENGVYSAAISCLVFFCTYQDDQKQNERSRKSYFPEYLD